MTSQFVRFDLKTRNERLHTNAKKKTREQIHKINISTSYTEHHHTIPSIGTQQTTHTPKFYLNFMVNRFFFFFGFDRKILVWVTPELLVEVNKDKIQRIF